MPSLGRAMADGRRGRRSDLNSKIKNAPHERGDEQEGTWPRDQLVRMDAKFCRTVERAIARGAERPKGEPRT
jgi:hypothetical protein